MQSRVKGRRVSTEPSDISGQDFKRSLASDSNKLPTVPHAFFVSDHVMELLTTTHQDGILCLHPQEVLRSVTCTSNSILMTVLFPVGV